MPYIVGALSCFSVVLIYYIYRSSRIRQENELKEKELRRILDQSENDIIRTYDGKIDSIETKSLDSNEKILGYLNDKTLGPR